MFWKTSGGVRRLHGRWEWLPTLRAIMNVSSLWLQSFPRPLFSPGTKPQILVYIWSHLFLTATSIHISVRFQTSKAAFLPTCFITCRSCNHDGGGDFFHCSDPEGGRGGGGGGVANSFYSLHSSFSADWKVISLVLRPSSRPESITIQPFCLCWWNLYLADIIGKSTLNSCR